MTERQRERAWLDLARMTARDEGRLAGCFLTWPLEVGIMRQPARTDVLQTGTQSVESINAIDTGMMDQLYGHCTLTCIARRLKIGLFWL